MLSHIPLYLNLSSGVSFIILLFLEKGYIASPSLKWMTKSQYPTIIEKSLQSNESHLYEVDIRGIFRWEALDPGDFVLLTSPTPWGKFSTLLNPFYNPPGWPGVLPLGQADDMCIINTGTWKHFLSYMCQKVLPYHLTEFKLCRVRNSARSVESYCTFVTYHIRTLKILFYNLGAVRTPK